VAAYSQHAAELPYHPWTLTPHAGTVPYLPLLVGVLVAMLAATVVVVGKTSV